MKAAPQKALFQVFPHPEGNPNKRGGVGWGLPLLLKAPQTSVSPFWRCSQGGHSHANSCPAAAPTPALEGSGQRGHMSASLPRSRSLPQPLLALLAPQHTLLGVPRSPRCSCWVNGARLQPPGSEAQTITYRGKASSRV